MELDSMKLELLCKARTKGTVQELESSVKVGIEILDKIKLTMKSAKEIKEVAKILKSIDKVKKKGQPQRAVVGVVGGTGAGKSSVINALLDEKSLAPTSGMRACTAVITEISYNNSESQDALYQAEVHFIAIKDWKNELGILLDELRTNPGSSNVDLSEGEVGIAYSKLKAVYPGITKDELLKGQHTPDSLVKHASVVDILGTKVQLSAPVAVELSKSLQVYIDAVDSQTGGRENRPSMEYWPLVKVVKIFVRSPVLESGLVLVDLPGVHDSNAARAAVAAKYVAECTGLWVIAPITRAVDDKSAETLLGESFKRQLQIDGSYSAITFICSKTDDFSVVEIMRAMPETERAHEIYAQLTAAENELQRLSGELLPMESRLNELGGQIDNLQKEINTLAAAIEDAAKNENSSTSVSLSPTKKRKQRAAAVQSRKRTLMSIMSGSEFSDSEDSEEDELAASDCEKLDQMKQEQKLAFDEKIELTKTLKPAKRKVKDARAAVKELRSLLANQCLQFRNNFVTPVIKHQFADGLKDIDQEVAFQRDPESFDPGFEARNYHEVARKLPVFCVSSRCYQQKVGLVAERNRSYPGFRNLEDTQIPQLKEHAQNTVHDMRMADCRNFVDQLAQCLTSLMIQVVLAEKPLKMADEIRQKELKFLEESMDKLRKDLDDQVLKCFRSLNKVVKLNVLDKFPAAVRCASDGALNTVASWARPRKEGGLAMQTYRATVRRAGVFSGASGLHDLNEELAHPLVKAVSSRWEKTFTGSLPKQIDSLAKGLAGPFKTFQDGLDKRPKVTEAISYALVKEQTKTFAEAILDTVALKSEADSAQRDANRMFVPTIAAAMSSVYIACSQETGTGTLARMREHMESHVERVRHTMFQEAVRKVEDRLVDLLKDMQESVDERVHSVADTLNDDFKALIEGKGIFETFVQARVELRQILVSADDRFKETAEDEEDDTNLTADRPVPGPAEPVIKTEPTI